MKAIKLVLLYQIISAILSSRKECQTRYTSLSHEPLLLVVMTKNSCFRLYMLEICKSMIIPDDTQVMRFLHELLAVELDRWTYHPQMDTHTK
jgi:hypothetical protein